MGKKWEILEKGKRLFVGIDMHLRSWTVTVRTRDEELETVTMEADKEVLGRFLGRYAGHRIEAVYEAGYFGYALHDYLQAQGIDCVVVPPSMIPESAGNRVKTDRKDSRKLARCLSHGELKRVSVPSVEERAARMVSRRRRTLIADRTRVQLRVKAELRFLGVSVPEVGSPWSVRGRQMLEALVLSDRWATESFRQLLHEYDGLDVQVKEQTRLLRELAETEAYRAQQQLLRTIPGIGLITAMELLLELQDVGRFRKAKALAAYLGLTPSQYSSGEHVRYGAITRMGKPALRSMLVESAWVLIRKDALMRERYERLRTRAGAKRAIVAIARHLALIARRVILDRQPYQMCSTMAA